MAPAIRDANRGDSRGSIRRKTPIFRRLSDLRKVASNLRVTIFSAPKRDSQVITLPALQKHFVNIFFVVAWEFCIDKGRGFLGIFSGLRFLGNKARKLLEKFGENSEQNSGGNSRTKFEKFGELSFCHFSDLTSKKRGSDREP